jgi:leucyl aminopeptidase
VPATDNRISGEAMCPGDVYTGVSGISVEIDNTDAEGRLILADALGYATRFKPSHVVDLATLTGAAVVALGDQATALFSNDDRLADQLLRCAREADELVWRLPLWTEYEEKLKSVTADVKNAGGRWAGAITAALFLRKFVPPGVKWCHLDMAGRMKAESDQVYHALGLPYGFGPRLLGRWLRSLSASL